MRDADPVIIEYRADTSQVETEIQRMTDLSSRFGSAIGTALKGAVIDGKSLGDVLKNLALRLSDITLNAAMKPLENLIGGAMTNILPFAKGGVVNRPTGFPLAGGQMGLMGESGAEAILPLARGADGRLGVSSGGGGGGPVSVTVNIQTPDAASFAKSQGQVSATLARAVSRGMRHL